MYDTKRLNGKFATDTLYGATVSLRGNKASQIYSHKCGFKALYHLSKANNEQIGQSLKDFIFEYGAPSKLTYDGAAVQVGSKTLFQETIRRADIKHHVSSPYRSNENPAESAIRDLKLRWYRLQTKMDVPNRLWDYGISYVCETGNVIVNTSKYSKGRTPLECITGETPNISEYLDFGFYDWVTFRNNAGLGNAALGRWLGVSHRVGQLMSYWILYISGIPVSCTTVQRLTELEKQTNEWKQRMDTFTETIEAKLGNSVRNVRIPEKDLIGIPQRFLLELEKEDDEFYSQFTKTINDPSLQEADDCYDQEYGSTDSYIGMKLGIVRGPDNDVQHAHVRWRVIDEEGKPVGIPHDNPILDMRQYEVEFLDGETEVMTANLIAENILAQVDDNGHVHMMLDEIEDHRVLQDAVRRNEGTYKTSQGTIRKKRTTKGWELLVRWRDGSSNWVRLKDLKDSYPVDLMEYAVENNQQEEPAFA